MILPVGAELKKRHRSAIVTPYLGNSETGVDLHPVQGTGVNVNLDRQIRRGINVQIKHFSVPSDGLVLDVIALIGSSPFSASGFRQVVIPSGS